MCRISYGVCTISYGIVCFSAAVVAMRLMLWAVLQSVYNVGVLWLKLELIKLTFVTTEDSYFA